MVRLVFRPYTQVRTSICTSECLRTSTRVSPGLILLRHSSPSFGSQQICSYSNRLAEAARSVDGAPASAGSHLGRRSALHFHCARGFATQRLAHMLDSLVRVSRRAREDDFLRIATAHEPAPRRPKRPKAGHSKEKRDS